MRLIGVRHLLRTVRPSEDRDAQRNGIEMNSAENANAVSTDYSVPGNLVASCDSV